MVRLVNFNEAVKLRDFEKLDGSRGFEIGNNAYINPIIANFVSKFPNFRYHMATRVGLCGKFK